MPQWSSAAETYPKREARGVWLGPISSDWPTNRGTSASTVSKQKSQADDYLDKLKANGFNTVYFHARPYADRLFKIKSWTDPNTGKKYSLSEPASLYLSGTRGTEATYDALQYWIDGAHKRGMELYVWINPLRIGSKANVDALTNKTLAATAMQGSSWYIYNPAKESVKSHLEDIAGLLCGAYDIDGIVFDDYFYPDKFGNKTSCEDQADYDAYKSGGGKLSIGDWRRAQINEMIKRVHAVIQQVKPYVKFCVGPAGVVKGGVKSSDNLPNYNNYFPDASDWQYDGIYSDPIAWMREGSIDIISPQLYWQTTHKTNPFGPMSDWFTQVGKIFGVQFYSSSSCSILGSKDKDTGESLNTPANRADLVKQATFTRQYGQKYGVPYGEIFYSAHNVTGNALASELHAQLYQHPSLAPMVNGENAPNPGKVKNLKNSSNTLTWTAISGMRYVAYAVPASVSVSKARSQEGGFKAEYIIDMTYTNSMAIPSGKQSGYWYAVTVLDRYGNEWEATTLNAPYEEDVKVTLTSPANNTHFAADAPVAFKWTGTTGATFTIEVSTTSNFSKIVFSKSGVNLLDVTTSSLPSGTLYWRVKGSLTDYAPATSETRTITIAAKPFKAPVLAFPANGETVTEDINFVVEDVFPDKTWLEISANDSFSPLFYTTSEGWCVQYDGNNKGWLQKTVTLSMLPQGTYYWRARVTKDGYDDGYSEVRVFNVGKKGSVGSDYSIYREPDPYDENQIGNNLYELQNIWLRDTLHNNLNRYVEYHRDMVARPADGSKQLEDIVYITHRTANGSKAQSSLARYNAHTGQELDALPLSYDANYNAGTYPCNGILVDADNNLLTHNLAVANNNISLATVDPATGKCTTLFSTKTTYRIDHLDIVGSATSGTAYVLAASPNGSSSTIIQRWTLSNGSIAKHETFDLGVYFGAAGRVHAINYAVFYVDGSSRMPTLYRWGNTTALGTTSVTGVNTPVGMCTFYHDGQSYLVHACTDFANGLQFGVYTGSDFASTLSGQELQWVFPHSGLGTVKMGSSDFGTPICVLQRLDNGQAQVRAAEPVKTTIYVYSPGNGLAAYAITKRIHTGAADIQADTDDSAEAVYYTLQGQRVNTATAAPGIYIRRQGSSVTKVVLR